MICPADVILTHDGVPRITMFILSASGTLLPASKENLKGLSHKMDFAFEVMHGQF
jgi:hypothetical protein